MQPWRGSVKTHSVDRAGFGLPISHRRTFAFALQAPAHSDLPALRHPWLRWSATPAPGTRGAQSLPRRSDRPPGLSIDRAGALSLHRRIGAARILERADGSERSHGWRKRSGHAESRGREGRGERPARGSGQPRAGASELRCRKTQAEACPTLGMVDDERGPPAAEIPGARRRPLGERFEREAGARRRAAEQFVHEALLSRVAHHPRRVFREAGEL
jgi:hypothetical protein